MEGTDSKEDTQVDTEPEHTVLMSSKPLHRFVQKEPRSLGIVLVLFGCSEVLMGLTIFDERLENSNGIYVPFWLGAEFVLCGSLSIFTGTKPSKKMVTVCLAMYIISIFGIIVGDFYRIECLFHLAHLGFIEGPYIEEYWTYNRVYQLLSIEGVLLISSFCASVLLIFLSNVARLSLRSNHPQVIFQKVQTPPTQQST